MLRDCRICGPVGLAVCVCAVGGEAARSMKEPEAEAKVTLFIALRVGNAQPNSHDEPTAPTPNGAVLIRASSTASIGPQQGDWAIFPSSIASSPALQWRAPQRPPETFSVSYRST